MIKNRLIIYLPLICFLAFLLPNTRFSYLSNLMTMGRWVVLFLLLGYIIIYYLINRHQLKTYNNTTSNKINLIFLISFLWIGLSIFESVNERISLLKWAAFISFVLFCIIYDKLLMTKKQIIDAVKPIMFLFVLIIWTTPLAIKYFPQKLLISLGAYNGIFIFAPQLGHFLSVFGSPSTIYLLWKAQTKWSRRFYVITLSMSLYFTIASKSRTATFITVVLLLIALMRWKGRNVLYYKIICFLLLFSVVIMNTEMIKPINKFIYKYDSTGNTELMQSRTPFLQNTEEQFKKRELFGSGFGVQEQMAYNRGVFATSGFREQGSTIYGLLEEVGIVGAMPIFLCLLFMGYKCGISVLRSNDELELLLSRVFLTGLGLALVENYLLYLGNATSILVFFAFFMRERLLALSYISNKIPMFRVRRAGNISRYRSKLPTQ